jgi:hypothetical protein
MATKKEASASAKTPTKNSPTEFTSETSIAASEKKARYTAAQHYKEQDKVEVSVSPLYRPYFGDVMTIIINGVYCALPVDGRTYRLPKSFANEVARRIHAIDKQNTRAERLSDVQNNHENFVGELKLI